MKDFVLKVANRSYLFWKDVVQHFINVDALNRAASLAYTTILSCVPLAVVGIGILSAFPVFDEYSDKIQSFLISHLVADSADVIQSYFEGFASRAATLSAGMTSVSEWPVEEDRLAHEVRPTSTNTRSWDASSGISGGRRRSGRSTRPRR